MSPAPTPTPLEPSAISSPALRVDLEQRPARQEVAIQARAPLGQGPFAAVGLEVRAAFAEDARQADQGERADAQEDAQTGAQPQGT